MRRAVVVLPGLLCLVFIGYLKWPSGKRDFESVEDFRAWALAKGFAVCPEHDRPGGLLKDRQAGVQVALTKEGLTRFQSLAHVAVLDYLDSVPGEYRVWGRVIAWGNPEVIAALERER